jgi:uncharacterized protein YgiM (DUF1202 family)
LGPLDKSNKTGRLFFLLLLLICLICFSNACSAPVRPVVLYTIPTVTYLRDCPDYNCPVVGEIFNGDQVVVLNKTDTGWWRVQSERDQKIGWTQRDLLSETQLSVKDFIIAKDGTPLRDSPSQDVVSRSQLARGDRIQKLVERDGWWRVLVEKDRSMGWIPADSASEIPNAHSAAASAAGVVLDRSDQAVPPAKPASESGQLFVAAENVNLYLIPFNDAKVVKELRINDKVVKISQSGSEWIKVRYLETGAEGWALVRHFKDTPVKVKAQIVTEKERAQKKSQGKKPPASDPFKSETLEPEGM